MAGRRNPRSNTEIVSRLKRYDITPSEDFKEYLLVRCPHDDCPSHSPDGVVRPFVVHQRSFQRPRRSTIDHKTVLIGRSCPYCFRASRIR